MDGVPLFLAQGLLPSNLLKMEQLPEELLPYMTVVLLREVANLQMKQQIVLVATSLVLVLELYLGEDLHQQVLAIECHWEVVKEELQDEFLVA